MVLAVSFIFPLRLELGKGSRYGGPATHGPARRVLSRPTCPVSCMLCCCAPTWQDRWRVAMCIPGARKPEDTIVRANVAVAELVLGG
jgi:hypothetical protein